MAATSPCRSSSRPVTRKEHALGLGTASWLTTRRCCCPTSRCYLDLTQRHGLLAPAVRQSDLLLCFEQKSLEATKGEVEQGGDRRRARPAVVRGARRRGRGARDCRLSGPRGDRLASGREKLRSLVPLDVTPNAHFVVGPASSPPSRATRGVTAREPRSPRSLPRSASSTSAVLSCRSLPRTSCCWARRRSSTR